MARLTEKDIMSAEHKYFMVGTDLYGYKIMLKAAGVRKFIKGKTTGNVFLFDLPVNDYLMVKYHIPKGSDIYVSDVNVNLGAKKCRASAVEIIEIREIVEEENGNIRTGKIYNGYGYSTHVVLEALSNDMGIMSACSKPNTYGRCKKNQKLIMKDFFHLTPSEIDKELSENSPLWYRSVYNGFNVSEREARCKHMATCNRGFHFFMKEEEAFAYLKYDILMRPWEL